MLSEEQYQLLVEIAQQRGKPLLLYCAAAHAWTICRLVGTPLRKCSLKLSSGICWATRCNCAQARSR